VEWDYAPGGAMSFSVSADQKVTAITVAYNLNACSGTRTFSGLSLDIVVVNRPPGNPSVGPFDNPGFGYASGPIGQPNVVSVSGADIERNTDRRGRVQQFVRLW
jgi:hypothetical protein